MNSIRKKARFAQAVFRYSPVSAFKRKLWNDLRCDKFSFSTTTRYGTRIAGNTGDYIDKRVFYFGVWEPTLSKWLWDTLTPGAVFVDVGANIGYFSTLAAKRVGQAGRVIAIEPSDAVRVRLEENIALNSVSNVEVVPCVATCETGVTQLVQGPNGNSGQTRVVSGSATGTTVKGRPLDDILADVNLSLPTVIKVDVEGHELEVLKGARDTLKRLPKGSACVIEISPELAVGGKSSAAAAVDLMTRHGFSAMEMHNCYDIEDYFASANEAPSPLRNTIQKQTDVLFIK